MSFYAPSYPPVSTTTGGAASGTGNDLWQVLARAVGNVAGAHLLECRQDRDEVAQRGDGGEPDLRIGAVDGAGEIAGLLCGHGVNIR